MSRYKQNPSKNGKFALIRWSKIIIYGFLLSTTLRYYYLLILSYFRNDNVILTFNTYHEANFELMLFGVLIIFSIIMIFNDLKRIGESYASS